jgi:hypothetical protein
MLIVERLRAVRPVAEAAPAGGMTLKTVRKWRDRVLTAEPQPDSLGRRARSEPA